MGEEGVRHPVDEVISGKDIQALRVKEEDLTKVMGVKLTYVVHAEGTLHLVLDSQLPILEVFKTSKFLSLHWLN